MGSQPIGRVHPTEGIFPSIWPYRLRRLGYQPFTLKNPDRHRVGSPYGPWDCMGWSPPLQGGYSGGFDFHKVHQQENGFVGQNSFINRKYLR